MGKSAEPCSRTGPLTAHTLRSGTLPSSLTPYVFACKIQRAGSFKIEECELGELVPKFKYDVCLEEIDEVLGEYEDGPFIAGKRALALTPPVTQLLAPLQPPHPPLRGRPMHHRQDVHRRRRVVGALSRALRRAFAAALPQALSEAISRRREGLRGAERMV